ncbi:Alpha/Beta hydrolase protein [Sporodiniella umbellata]|nr:Alpha/Beta hydrolase protein [Sporodiniella umbellata]
MVCITTYAFVCTKHVVFGKPPWFSSTIKTRRYRLFYCPQLTTPNSFIVPFFLSTIKKYEAQGYRVLSSKYIEGYTVRIKQPTSCEDSVQYSGYIDKYDTDDHFFFYFTESRSNPQKDPLVLWLNGGPGCSSMMGLWMELGPCLVNKNGTGTIRNPYSWNNEANVIFLDQPVNVGYSYGSTTVKSTQESARDVYAFLQLFLDEYKEYASNPFHISGESYAGHYLPAISSEIIKKNRETPSQNLLRINYQSMLIGNGWTNPRIQFKEYSTFGCEAQNGLPSLFNSTVCRQMKTTYNQCNRLIDRCYRHPKSSNCLSANVYCENTQTGPFFSTGLNPYDIRVKCEGTSGLCYDEIEKVQRYANDPWVKKNLGVDPMVTIYESCSNEVGYQFDLNGDGVLDFSPKVAETLNAGIHVLLYVGEMDWVCNWIGNLKWSLSMNWKGKNGYNQASTKPWYNSITGKLAGNIKSFENLSFLRVFDAGHMVPLDQPENSLDFFNKWLNRRLLAN